ncbi:MAG: 4Fe-4S dicluster domain-containing protein [Desulfitobacterium sp.]|nr:4Fe-4S dicluster domain-containing protein [Desulfitobacterium sp.]
MTKKKSYILEHCRKNCSKTSTDWSALYEELEEILQNMDLDQLINKLFPVLHHHHRPKITLAGCPNGCSQPQIKDIGISGYVNPQFTDEECIGCKICIDACREQALFWQNKVILEPGLCIGCGDCFRNCPTGTIVAGERGWNLLLGGRLGRRPQLACLVETGLDSQGVLEKVQEILEAYQKDALPGERLSQFLDRQNYLLEKDARLAKEKETSLS